MCIRGIVTGIKTLLLVYKRGDGYNKGCGNSRVKMLLVRLCPSLKSYQLVFLIEYLYAFVTST